MKTFTLSIPRPCNEKWNTLAKTGLGGFCNSCNKTVIDFTKMNPDEIVAFLGHERGHTCGRFRRDQLRSYPLAALPKIAPGIALLKAGLMAILLTMISKPGRTQDTPREIRTELIDSRIASGYDSIPAASAGHKIRGVVRSTEDNEPIPAANVLKKGSTEGTITTANGEFQFPSGLKEGDVLVFSFIGFTTQEYIVTNSGSDHINICMDPDTGVLGEIIMMGEVAVNKVYSEPEKGIRAWFRKLKEKRQ